MCVSGYVLRAPCRRLPLLKAGRQALSIRRERRSVLRELERVANVMSRSAAFTSDVLAGPVVTDAPFSADATTTVTQILGDGTRIEQTTNARFYRDRAGRVRREQTILGLGALNAGGNMQTITIDPDPGDGTAYTLDPMTRTARRVPRIAIPLAGEHDVSHRSAANHSRAGSHWRSAARRHGRKQPDRRGCWRAAVRRRQGPRPQDDFDYSDGQIGNDRPIEITDERWESPELRMLVYSRNSDPRTGVVEYRLTNINRSEPPADLFMIPQDYTSASRHCRQRRRRRAPGTRGRRGARIRTGDHRPVIRHEGLRC